MGKRDLRSLALTCRARIGHFFCSNGWRMASSASASLMIAATPRIQSESGCGREGGSSCAGAHRRCGRPPCGRDGGGSSSSSTGSPSARTHWTRRTTVTQLSPPPLLAAAARPWRRRRRRQRQRQRVHGGGGGSASMAAAAAAAGSEGGSGMSTGCASGDDACTDAARASESATAICKQQRRSPLWLQRGGGRR